MIIIYSCLYGTMLASLSLRISNNQQHQKVPSMVSMHTLDGSQRDSAQVRWPRVVINPHGVSSLRSMRDNAQRLVLQGRWRCRPQLVLVAWCDLGSLHAQRGYRLGQHAERTPWDDRTDPTATRGQHEGVWRCTSKFASGGESTFFFF